MVQRLCCSCLHCFALFQWRWFELTRCYSARTSSQNGKYRWGEILSLLQGIGCLTSCKGWGGHCGQRTDSPFLPKESRSWTSGVLRPTPEPLWLLRGDPPQGRHLLCCVLSQGEHSMCTQSLFKYSITLHSSVWKISFKKRTAPKESTV